jgi:hypothetical protein
MGASRVAKPNIELKKYLKENKGNVVCIDTVKCIFQHRDLQL